VTDHQKTDCTVQSHQRTIDQTDRKKGADQGNPFTEHLKTRFSERKEMGR
jgi:hypothetical protein